MVWEICWQIQNGILKYTFLAAKKLECRWCIYPLENENHAVKTVEKDRMPLIVKRQNLCIKKGLVKIFGE